MSLPAANYITDLDPAQPVGSQNISEGDDWLRLLQLVIKQSFPAISGAVTPTHTELNYVDGVTSAIQTQLDGLVLSVTAALGNAPLWVSGNTYAVPAVVYSPLTFTNYRKITASSVTTTDPSLDKTNWVSLTSFSGQVLLLAGTASASATIDVTTNLTSAYEEYELHFQNFVPSAGGAVLIMRTSANAGSTWDSGASDYSYARNNADSAASSSISGSAGNTSILLHVTSASTTAAHGGVSGVVRIINPAGTTSNKQLLTDVNVGTGAGTLETSRGSAVRNATAAINGVRLLFNSGNVASGSYKLYGLRKTV